MRAREAVQRVILRLLPWYHESEVEGRHADTRRVIRDARRTLAMIDDYRRADARIGRMSGQ